MDRKQEKILGKLVAKAWTDKTLYDRLLADPNHVLQEAGVILGGIAVVVVVFGTGQEATAATLEQKLKSGVRAVIEIVLPPKPADLMDENFGEMGGMAGEMGDDVPFLCFCVRGCVC